MKKIIKFVLAATLLICDAKASAASQDKLDSSALNVVSQSETAARNAIISDANTVFQGMNEKFENEKKTAMEKERIRLNTEAREREERIRNLQKSQETERKRIEEEQKQLLRDFATETEALKIKEKESRQRAEEALLNKGVFAIEDLALGKNQAISSNYQVPYVKINQYSTQHEGKTIINRAACIDVITDAAGKKYSLM
jgi:hypothetical protein